MVEKIPLLILLCLASLHALLAVGFWVHDFSSVLLYILLYLREQWLFSLLAGSFTAVFDDSSEGSLGVRYLGCVFVSGPHQGRTYFLTSSSRDQKRFRARYMELSSFFFVLQ
jgi:hypothetical protein